MTLTFANKEGKLVLLLRLVILLTSSLRIVKNFIDQVRNHSRRNVGVFQGICPFRIYMPKKPKKYGVKVKCLTDSSTSYLVDAYIYKGINTNGEGLCDEEKCCSAV